MLKLGRRARGHFVTLIEIRVHLIRVKPGHISEEQPNAHSIFFTIYRDTVAHIKLHPFEQREAKCVEQVVPREIIEF